MEKIIKKAMDNINENTIEVNQEDVEIKDVEDIEEETEQKIDLIDNQVLVNKIKKLEDENKNLKIKLEKMEKTEELNNDKISYLESKLLMEVEKTSGVIKLIKDDVKTEKKLKIKRAFKKKDENKYLKEDYQRTQNLINNILAVLSI